MWILPIGGVALGNVCASSLGSRFVFQSCRPILDKLDLQEVPSINVFIWDTKETTRCHKVFIKMDNVRKQLLGDLLVCGWLSVVWCGVVGYGIKWKNGEGPREEDKQSQGSNF